MGVDQTFLSHQQLSTARVAKLAFWCLETGKGFPGPKGHNAASIDIWMGQMDPGYPPSRGPKARCGVCIQWAPGWYGKLRRAFEQTVVLPV